MYQRPKCIFTTIRIFRKRWSLILGCFFPVRILNFNLNFSQLCTLPEMSQVKKAHEFCQ